MSHSYHHDNRSFVHGDIYSDHDGKGFLHEGDSAGLSNKSYTHGDQSFDVDGSFSPSNHIYNHGNQHLSSSMISPTAAKQTGSPVESNNNNVEKHNASTSSYEHILTPDRLSTLESQIEPAATEKGANASTPNR